MSLRKSPRLTATLVTANRKNAQKSTGPQSAASKERAKWSALRHGRYAAFPGDHRAMLALGEDPEEFERLKQELLAAYGPGDALWVKQVEDLVRLYWRRARLERAHAGMLRRELEAQQFEQACQQRQVAEAGFDTTEHEVLQVVMPQYRDLTVRLRQLLSFLEMLREQVAQRTFDPRQGAVLRELSAERLNWRMAIIHTLLRRFADSRCGSTPPGEEDHRKLLALLEQEIRSVREEFDLARRADQETALAERDACLAPTGKGWTLVLRQENALDRAIDRKVRILMSLRNERARQGGKEPSAAPPPETPTEKSESRRLGRNAGLGVEARKPVIAVTLKLRERSRNPKENKGASSEEAGTKPESS